MNKLAIKSGLLACALVLAVSGCANNTAGVMSSSTGEVRIDNSSLAADVSIEQLNTRQVGELLQGAGTLVSHVSDDQHLQYKFSWFDGAGFALDNEGSAWKSVVVHGMQQVQVMGVAPNATAVRYQLYVREVYSN